jgi:hypothetical protein
MNLTGSRNKPRIAVRPSKIRRKLAHTAKPVTLTRKKTPVSTSQQKNRKGAAVRAGRMPISEFKKRRKT